MKIIRNIIAGVALMLSIQVSAFTVSDIRVEGLRRVSVGSVFSAMPVNVGDDVSTQDMRNIIKALFKTGSFDDVQLGRDGSLLIVLLTERPAIDSLEIEGNKAIKSEALLEGLSNSGLSEGEIFKKVTLEHIRTDLERQYVSQGRYGARIDTELETLPRNRVAIKIKVKEGDVAGIRHINIVGNKVYDNETLLEQIELKLPSFMSFYTKDDRYSKEKLTGDLEKLESWYLDRGYLNFLIDSTQVSIAPNKEDVYITINLIEGEEFTVGDVDITGELHDIPEDGIRRLVYVKPGQLFSRELITFSEEQIEKALGNAGYTFASAKGQPVQNEDGKTVDIKFFVDAGKRAYVRRINFTGNTFTKDEVLRREMRQMEAGWASNAYIENSKIRLERLGFFKEVSVETIPVPGTDDQVDVEYTVEEQPSGSISATLGYSQGRGLMIGANYQERNVLGTGNSTNFGVNHSLFQSTLNISFFDPYFTVDEVSRGYSVFYRKSDFGAINRVPISMDSYGGNINRRVFFQRETALSPAPMPVLEKALKLQQFPLPLKDPAC